MQKYINNVVGISPYSYLGSVPVNSASVTVSNYPGGTLATLYSDNGVTTKANPVTTDSLGNFSFYAADGRYSLTISGTGKFSVSQTYVTGALIIYGFVKTNDGSMLADVQAEPDDTAISSVMAVIKSAPST